MQKFSVCFGVANCKEAESKWRPLKALTKSVQPLAAYFNKLSMI